MKRFLFSLLVVLVTGSASAAIVPAPPQVAAEAYLLIDADTGTVLAEGNADGQDDDRVRACW